MKQHKVYVIGEFPLKSKTCIGCGEELLVDNAWMTDGCPCNSPLGVNDTNQVRWLLLMELQQKHAEALLKKEVDFQNAVTLVVRLARACPVEALKNQAMDWLKRKGLLGSPLR